MTEARPHEKEGTSSSRRLRSEGKIPGVVYGLGESSVSVLVNIADLRDVLTTDAGLNAIIGLEVGGKHKLCIVKELQRHPITRKALHVDFFLINPDEEVQVDVPINLIGIAKKVEQEQGIMDQILFELTVMSKPDSIPNLLEFDISDLEVGDTVTVGDIVLPPGTRALLEPETSVAIAELTRMALTEETPILEGEEGAEGVEGVEGAEGESSDGAGDAGGSSSGDKKDGGS